MKRGDRVRLVETTDPYTKLRPGTLGTVSLIDDMGTVHVRWDDGSQLGMVAEAGDRIVPADVTPLCGVAFMVGTGRLPGAEPILCGRPADHRPLKAHAEQMTDGDRRRYNRVDGGFLRWQSKGGD